ncbi:purine-binding chemotaxis protein CheW [Planktothrix sp. FACHB-1355]|uniref:Purine-binding chemotaxis protein CheW n=1 Tax=Aerosakkonema funiforme FACHB-1375 TaxID=2949571 RepID=A0A926ZKL7_9CYAN|nr:MULTISPECIES: chemotaxis protein CheW [Oscillatoriales]MBD2185919.1 purine-binding chemotaxis protein CheW [Aerosakkonema funiforme FACHB-1375]MBD3558252.1 purine-binding chemotaxis protein CheW [Planktothrix sp. FACHB-1355]
MSNEPFIIFELVGTKYAISSQMVQRMEMIEQITPVPNSPSFVEGVVFSRGQVIPAINLRVRFGFEKIRYDIRTRLIVIKANDRTVGLIADSAREFVVIPADAIQPPPEAICGLSDKYLTGIAISGEKLVLILNCEEVLKFSNNSLAAFGNS